MSQQLSLCPHRFVLPTETSLDYVLEERCVWCGKKKKFATRYGVGKATDGLGMNTGSNVRPIQQRVRELLANS